MNIFCSLLRRSLARLCARLACAAGLALVPALRADVQVASVTPWPEADALFHRDPRWLGSDCAYSVDLGGGRVLWLFGDTFIATSAAHRRRESKMPRNTVALQRGYDPSRADITFYWQENAQGPASFFPERGEAWLWPGGGARLGDRLVLFFIKVRRTGDGMFGFAAIGSVAALVANPDDAPDRWRLTWTEVLSNPMHAIVGSGSALQVGDDLLAYSAVEPGPGHAVFVARWPVARVRQGDFSSPEWWQESAGRWVAQDRLGASPAPIFKDAQTEFTVHAAPRAGGFVQIQTYGFGDAELAFRFAPAATGPWSPLKSFHRPPESKRPGVMVYSGKAHPELTGADLVVTYASNTEWERCLDDTSLYYPRFVRVTLAQPTATPSSSTR